MPLRRAHNDVAEHEGKKAQTGVGWGMAGADLSMPWNTASSSPRFSSRMVAGNLKIARASGSVRAALTSSAREMVPPLLRSSRVNRRRRSSSVGPLAEAPLEPDVVGRCREYGAAPARASRPRRAGFDGGMCLTARAGFVAAASPSAGRGGPDSAAGREREKKLTRATRRGASTRRPVVATQPPTRCGHCWGLTLLHHSASELPQIRLSTEALLLCTCDFGTFENANVEHRRIPGLTYSIMVPAGG